MYNVALKENIFIDLRKLLYCVIKKKERHFVSVHTCLVSNPCVQFHNYVNIPRPALSQQSTSWPYQREEDPCSSLR